MHKYDDVINVTKTRLQKEFYSQDLIPSDEDISSWLSKTLDFLDVKLSESNTKELFDILKQDATNFSQGSTGIKRKRKKWMHERSDEQKDDYYSSKYEQYLTEKGEIPPTAIRSIFKESDEILDLLADPLSRDGFKKKGLVMGDVQSGKTANYLGLINRAADVKYKLIILIAGIHVNLRQQTQQRVNDGFIGRNSVSGEYVGVGEVEPIILSKTPTSLTGLDGDFNLNQQNNLIINPESSTVPVILVIKKNVSTLNSVINQFRDFVGRNQATNKYPFLLIDDEADNASVNYNDEDEDPTRINEKIRELLGLFSKSSYVGFTATPFANMFIDPDAHDDVHGDDLFPEDFIISLTPPDSYVSPQKCFIDEESSNQIIRLIHDNEDTIPVPQPAEDFSITNLPDSCKRSIEMFLLSIALKIHRKASQKHTSMLINITHRVELHSDIVGLVDKHLKYLLNAIRYEKNNTGSLSKELKNLQQIWADEYKSEGNFDELLRTIDKVSGSIQVKLINSTSEDVMNYREYENGLHAIVVGGFSLSRGFTFEGLTISYLLRLSRMSDTFLQMGRWFGYRIGYEDLCRIFLLPISFNWYRHIAVMTNELREELNVAKLYNLTPKEYGLRIRNHPGNLLITAQNKMRTGTNIRMSLDYSASLFETNQLSIKTSHLQNNKSYVDQLLSTIGDPSNDANGYLWTDVSVEKIMDLIVPFKDPSDSIKYVRDYIKSGAEEELKKWDIFLATGGRSTEYKVADIFPVKKQLRTLQSSANESILSFEDGGARIVRIRDERIGLNDDELEAAENDLEASGIAESARFYRQHRSKPLLVIKVFDVTYGVNQSCPDLYAYGISFPVSPSDRSREYIYTRTALNN